MQIFTSYKSAFHACMDTQSFAIAHLHKLSKNMQIDTSGCYKIFLSMCGNKVFHIDDYIYQVNANELFFINPREWHYFSHFDDTKEHERFVMFIYPEYIQKLSSTKTDLTWCFPNNYIPQHNLLLSRPQKEQFLKFIHQMSAVTDYGQDLLDHSLFLQLMIFFNQIVIHYNSENSPAKNTSRYYSETIDEIVLYLNSHIAEELSINTLAEHFFLSPSHLCKTFKAITGTTIHKYITAKRITLAKDYLSQGYSAIDVSMMCGYNDYNAFLKAFTKETGISPTKYAKFSI